MCFGMIGLTFLCGYANNYVNIFFIMTTLIVVIFDDRKDNYKKMPWNSSDFIISHISERDENAYHIFETNKELLC